MNSTPGLKTGVDEHTDAYSERFTPSSWMKTLNVSMCACYIAIIVSGPLASAYTDSQYLIAECLVGLGVVLLVRSWRSSISLHADYFSIVGIRTRTISYSDIDRVELERDRYRLVVVILRCGRRVRIHPSAGPDAEVIAAAIRKRLDSQPGR